VRDIGVTHVGRERNEVARNRIAVGTALLQHSCCKGMAPMSQAT